MSVRDAGRASRGPILLFVILSSAAGCGYPKSGAVPEALGPADVTAAKARWPDADESKLAAGRSLFVARCNACHGYPDIRAIDEARWPDIVARMGKKAGLDPASTEEVLQFVLTARQRT